MKRKLYFSMLVLMMKFISKRDRLLLVDRFMSMAIATDIKPYANLNISRYNANTMDR